MKDETFVPKLVGKELIPGDLINKIGSGSNLTQREAAACFLVNAIEPAINTTYNKPFSVLLSEMESFSNQLKNLAGKIKKDIQMLNNPITGKSKMYLYISTHTYIRMHTIYHRHGKIRWAKHLQFKPHGSFCRNAFALP